MEEHNEFEIDLVDLLFYLKKRFLIIVAALLVGALLGFVASSFFMTPEYTASTRMYVLSQGSDDSLAYSDFQLSNQVLVDFQVLVKGRNVTEKVIDELGLDMSDSQLSGKISITAMDTSRVLQITVTDEDPQRTADIANKVTEIAAQQTKNFMNLEAVNIVYDAKVPTAPSSPNVMRNTMLAALVCGVLAAGVLVVICILDDTIRTEDDVQRHLGLPTLGVIPVSKELDPAMGKAKPKGKMPAPAQKHSERPEPKK